jgi:hypothetical protein
MVAKGYTRDYAERIFKQIEGFGEYGFPESHAASFALLVYVSAWLKCHHPDAFLAALLNSQPMGFYAPAQLVRDAREHGVRCGRSTCCSERLGLSWRTLEGSGRGRRAGAPLRPVRLGFNRISGFGRRRRAQRAGGRARRGAVSPAPKTWRAARGSTPTQLRCWPRPTRCAAWPATATRPPGPWPASTPAPRRCCCAHAHARAAAALAAPDVADTVLADYRATGLSLTQHPLACCATQLAPSKVQPAAVLRTTRNGRLARASGLVTHRQRPETAKGVVFVTLEDETGAVNVIVWPAGGRGAAPAAAGHAAHGLRRLAVRRRGAPPGGAQAGRPLALLQGLGCGRSSSAWAWAGGHRLGGFSQGAILRWRWRAHDGIAGRVLAFGGCYAACPRPRRAHHAAPLPRRRRRQVIPADGSRGAGLLAALQGDATLDIARAWATSCTRC